MLGNNSEKAASDSSLVPGFDPVLTTTVSGLSGSIVSIALYVREFTVDIDFDRETKTWSKRLSDDGEFGLLIKAETGELIVLQVTDSGMFWELQEGRRLSVEAFDVIKTAKGSIRPETLVEYLELVKHRLYSRTTAILPKYFAIDCFEFILRESKGVLIIDSTDSVIDKYLVSQGKQFPPLMKAPLEH